MLTTSSRPITGKLTSKLAIAAAACLALLALSSAPALAASTCEGQTFSQPFEALGDYNYYTLVQGSQFNSSSEGWRLSDGAQIVEASRPDASKVCGTASAPRSARSSLE